jgi:hypothetical protein
MKRILEALALSLAACADVDRAPSSAGPAGPPADAFDPIAAAPILAPEAVALATQGGRAPNLTGSPLFSNAGAFNFSGATAPGTATFTAAPVIDWLSGAWPTALGTGAWQGIQAGGSTWSTSAAESMSGVLPDDRGVDYLLLTAYTEEIDPATGSTIGTVVHALVLASDFGVGQSVNLDGVDRLALFARGDISLPDPQIAAAAVTGTISFSAGGLAINDLITADLAGDFAEFMWSTSSQPPPATGVINPGSYTLTHDPSASVFCDGTLMGQEAAFAGIGLQGAGFTDGPVTIAAGALPGSFDISGAPITAGYGVATLTLEAMQDAPPGVVGGFVNGSGAGPLGTVFAGTYLMLDGTTTTSSSTLGFAGAGYLTPQQDGFCSVDFFVEVGP